ncbi:MAG: hypothetical protein SVW57_07870 [Thermodesulfobacteriota bacterium]|nr:hypothetical protein [Thermodesulfobacteriota bacterium]
MKKKAPINERLIERPRNHFFLVAGVGHCGTKWLAHVLHRPVDRIVCYHEEKLQNVPLNWKNCLQHEFEKGLDFIFDDYFSFMQRELETYTVAGDSNSWTMYMIPEVSARLPVAKIIYLVRNGIQSVHSFFYHNLHIPYNDFLYTKFFRHYWELIGCPGGNWNEYSPWACWCLWWQVNQFMPSWLADHLNDIEIMVYRFEDLIENTHLLSDLIKKLQKYAKPSHEDLMVFQQTEINQKIQGDRSPLSLWNKWSDEQRSTFKYICGSSMEHYGYELPWKN